MGCAPLIEPCELWREEKAMPGHDPARYMKTQVAVDFDKFACSPGQPSEVNLLVLDADCKPCGFYAGPIGDPDEPCWLDVLRAKTLPQACQVQRGLESKNVFALVDTEGNQAV